MKFRTSGVCVKTILAGMLAGAFLIGEAVAQEKVLNLYTARHYATDEAFYSGYSKATGVKINRIEGGEDALFERIKAEGANSPADVFLTVDVARLWRAEQAGIFAPVNSKPGGILATVEEREFLGGEILYRLRLPSGATVHLEQRKPVHWPVGHRVSIEVHLPNVVVFSTPPSSSEN